MTIKNAVLPPDSIVVVTGANGFIASHVVDQVLGAGYKVRGTVRDLEKSAWVQEIFDKKYGPGRLSLVKVPDMNAEGAYDEVVKGASGFLHLATTISPDLDPHSAIPTVVNGTLNAVKAAAKEPSIKRFVLTSSSTAATLPKPNLKFDLDQSTWNEESIQKAWAPPPYTEERRWDVYGASKTEGERALWNFVKENKPGFVANAVLPNANFGPVLDKRQGRPSTAAWVLSFFLNEGVDKLLTTEPQYFVNVQDNARLHLAALIHPDVENERIYAFADPYNWNDLLATFRELYPDRKFIDDLPNLGHDLSIVKTKPRSEQLLRDLGRPGFAGLKESVKACVESLL